MHIAKDAETFPNVFTLCVSPIENDDWWVYEISNRRNDALYLYNDIASRKFTRAYGFNKMAFDYPPLHYFMGMINEYGVHLPAAYITDQLYKRAQQLIAVEWGKGWQNHIWAKDQHIPQCDLMMLNHFDNVAKLTSLKDLEFNLECEHVAEMPFEIGQVLRDDQIDELIAYNYNDTVPATKKFVHKCMDAIKFREGLIAKGTFGPECLNWNDVKIGERFFLKRLEAAKPGVTKPDRNGRKPQTWRAQIKLADIIFPYIQFERPELRQLIGTLKDTTVAGTETKGAYNHRFDMEGVEISIGSGGIHGARERFVVHSTVERDLIDIDVTGYYPSIAIVNCLYPAHIGPIFVDVYRQIRDERAAAKRNGDVVAAGTLKLSNNGAFGKTNDMHSVLYDPAVMMGITVNGQLLQCLLAEAIMRVPGCQLIQLNTDGLTVSIPKSQRAFFNQVCSWWQDQTQLELEFFDLQSLWMRDVNNYLALDAKGKIKRKGAYDHEMVSGSVGGQKAWNKDFSALVVPKAAEAAFVHDQDPADFIERHQKKYDFLLRERVKGGSRLVLGHSGANLGKLVRYYIATNGEPLVNIMPPLKGKADYRRIGVHAEGRAHAVGERKNYRCSACGEHFAIKALFDEHNKHAHAWPIRVKMHWDNDLTDIDHNWYVEETERLLF